MFGPEGSVFEGVRTQGDFREQNVVASKTDLDDFAFAMVAGFAGVD